ncbi:MAG: hypothetical protein ABI615_00780 [Chthoniobacterales bacterium]
MKNFIPLKNASAMLACLTLLCGAFSTATAQVWNLNANGNWNTSNNWSTHSVPNSVGASATLGSAITANRTITLGQNITVGSLTISDNNNYTVTGNRLTMDASGSNNASITVSGSGSPLIQSSITLNDNTYFTQNGTGTFTVSGSITTNGKSLTTNGSGNTVLSGTISSGGGFTKSGSGTTTLSGTANNNFSNVTVSGGTLNLDKTDGKNAIGGTGTTTVNVNSAGTLVLGGNNQIANTVNMILNGGTFSTGATTGYNETLGTLTLNDCSTIDLGTGSHNLVFANSSSLDWDGTLTITGWVGTAASIQGGTQGSIFFGSNSSGLSSNQLCNIDFTGFGHGAMLLSTGELVPLSAVPEAKVVMGVLLLVGFVGWRERNRIRGWSLFQGKLLDFGATA